MDARGFGGVLLIAGLLLAHGTGSAQEAPAFEVASVRENRSGGMSRMSAGLDLVMFGPNALPPPGQISFTNAPLRDIVVLAYRLDQSVARYTLVGLAERVLKARFDIVAKPPEGAPPSQTLPMLRRLLTDRFHLRTHTETRQVPAYILTIARDGKLGPQLRPSSHDCTSPSMPQHAGERARLGPKGPDGEPVCPGILYGRSTTGEMTVRYASPLSFMLSLLQAFVDRPIVDATGLRGSFEWAVSFSSEQRADPFGTPMVTALREQLGLKLEQGLHPIEVLVVDSVEMPTPN